MIALVAYVAQSPRKDSGKPSANAASGGAGTPKASNLRTTSGEELGSRENSGNRKLRTTRVELPDDPSQIKELTPELAKLLFAEFKRSKLHRHALGCFSFTQGSALESVSQRGNDGGHSAHGAMQRILR